MKWFFILLIFLVQCRFYDFRQEALTGTTFQERNWKKESNTEIFFFSSKLQSLPSGEKISFRKFEYSFLAGVFGNMIGNTAYKDNFSDYFPLKQYKIRLTEGKYLVIHNIRIKYNSNIIFDGFKLYSVIMVGYYTIEAELNLIPKEDFQRLLGNKGQGN